jgi:transposase InsO family protein
MTPRAGASPAVSIERLHITYVPTSEGWLYLAAVVDLASRRAMGWSMSGTIDANLVCSVLLCDRHGGNVGLP